MPTQLRLAENEIARSVESVSALDTTDAPRHRWYFFKEAFSPSVVEAAIQQEGISQDDVIIDPFCGSGTVPLTASNLGVRTFGYEVNPFLAFVSTVKTSSFDREEVEDCIPEVVQGIDSQTKSKLEGFSTFTRSGDRTKWLFNLDVIRSFEGGWKASQKLPRKSKRLLQLALLSSAMDNCNARKDGKCLRYKSDWQEKDYSTQSFLYSFQKRINQALDDLGEYTLSGASDIDNRDSRDSDAFNEAKGFDLCVTSPPYLNSFDYTDIYRPELFLGKFVTDMAELRQLRLDTLRSHVQVKWEDPDDLTYGKRYTDFYSSLMDKKEALWNHRIMKMVPAYFEDMKQVFSNLYDQANEDASIWLIVSTSAYAGIEAPVDLILSDVAEDVGWNARGVYELRKLRRVAVQQWDALTRAASEKQGEESEPYLRESVVILDR